MNDYIKREISSIINKNKDKSLNTIKKKIHEFLDEEKESFDSNNNWRVKGYQQEARLLRTKLYKRIKTKDFIIPLKEVEEIKKLAGGTIVVRANNKDYRFEGEAFGYLLDVFN